jgi:hypothetical protein
MKLTIQDKTKATVLLMVSLFLPLIWRIFPYESEWTFPFFDDACDCFSFNPKETRTYYFVDILPYYSSFILVPIYIYTRGLIPQMKVFGINLWSVHFVYFSLQALDLFLAFLMVQNYRPFFAFFGAFLHAAWWLKTDNNR